MRCSNHVHQECVLNDTVLQGTYFPIDYIYQWKSRIFKLYVLQDDMNILSNKAFDQQTEPKTKSRCHLCAISKMLKQNDAGPSMRL